MDRARAGGMTRPLTAGATPVDVRGAVIAVASEDDRYPAVRERAADLARSEGRPVILYDWDAPSPFAAPLPTWWSGDGSGERPAGPLDEHDLEMAGRATIARQVRQLRARGIAVGGWLPTDAGGAALGSFAMEAGAAAVVLPADLDDAGPLLPAAGEGEAPAGRVGASARPDTTSPATALRIIAVPAADRG